MINLEQIKADIAARKAMPAWGAHTSIERIRTINATLPSFSLKTVEALVDMLEKTQRVNAAQDDHINQQQNRIDQLESKSAELGRRLYQYSMVPDYFASLVAKARVRADKAMCKFPQPNYVLNKVAEESGEVIKAVIHYTEGREQWSNVESEIIDNLAMLLRLVKEGDQVMGFTPPDSCNVVALPASQQEGL
ncbi:hypothetical protein RYZ40_13600 [Raoultella planticola]|uniref:hypothetical protein n=1 Tax=Klebsiella/Raoultella group TaxID=2890311 RepID=UPI0007CC8D65|nr:MULTISPECIES: hypothetical protein [Klebsiella/Raoultella group]MCW9507917.1 hypothetical protein [Klebsiella michiganensis]MDU2811406.1 hypothetical protein [Klebsiella michiganensis]MDU4798990.1 hypothetical protein [Klebsiella michiganensis]MDW2728228.1 hypothetical protein [Raoultella planticola]SAP97769.1 Uncharacterised protein [Klebsiella oxytoca]